VTGLALVGKATIVSCFCTIFIYSSELFPTVIRSVGVGSCTFFGRVGSLLAPQVSETTIEGGLIDKKKKKLAEPLRRICLCFPIYLLRREMKE
jgi:hypothetical protein